MVSKNLSSWATEVQFGQIYEELQDNEKELDNAYYALDQFCKKEQRRSKNHSKRRKHCWQ